MKKSNIILISIIAIIVIIGISAVSTYNGLISMKEDVDAKYSNISVQLERRADLIPNLVNTVKGYTNHENEVLEKITNARSNLVNANSLEEKAEANNELTKALNNLFVIVENYPDLKSSQNFINLQDELAGTENRVATARRDYNESVKVYNSKIKKIPTNIIASLTGMNELKYFEVSEEKAEVPDVNFNN